MPSTSRGTEYPPGALPQTTLPVRRKRPGGHKEPYLPETRPAPAGQDKHRRPFSRNRIRPRAGIVLAILSAWIGLLWVAAVPPLGAPDEPAHLQAIMQVRNRHILPEVHFSFRADPTGKIIDTPLDDPTTAYAERLGQRAVPFRMLPYEGTQPPLYYLIVGVAAMALPPDPQIVLYLGRLIAMLFGAGTVYFCWAATRQFAPGAPLWAVGAAGAIMLLPQFCFNNVTAGNDSALNCLGVAALYVWFRGLREPAYDRWMVRAGAVTGLALLAKLTAVALLPGLGIILLARVFQGAPRGRTVRDLLRRGARLSAGAGAAILAVSGWWFIRNLITYGELSGYRDSLLFYTVRFARVDLTQPAGWEDLRMSTWVSIWGVFGWLDRLLPREFYDQATTISHVLLALSGVAAVLVARRWILRRQAPIGTWASILCMAAVSAVVIAGYLTFNTTVARQPQGRYLFLLLLPGALLLTGGLYALPPGRWAKSIALAALLLWLALMNVVGLALVS